MGAVVVLRHSSWNGKLWRMQLLLLFSMLLQQQQMSGVLGHYNFVPREYRHLGLQNVGAHLAPPLQFHYYKKQCPQLGSVVKRVIHKYTEIDDTTPAPLLRLFFHDCFVQGCDASLLLDSSKGTGEKEAPINFSIGNIEIVDEIKEVLEKECPGIVSCADVLALVAVYSIAQAGGPLYPIELGRRDSLTSFAENSETYLPPFNLNVSGLLENFEAAGLNLVDLVVLSGAHSIGQGHCNSIVDRIYPHVDPQYKKKYGRELLANCTDNGVIKAPNFNNETQFFMDPVTPLVFDNQYFKNFKKGLALFTSDQTLFNDPRTLKLVKYYARHEKAFFAQFGISLRKMGKIGVLTGTQGQIRKKCSVRNSHNDNPVFDPEQ